SYFFSLLFPYTTLFRSFFFISIILHKTPRLFLEAVGNSVKAASGIIIQFPFYAGLMGIVTASGLASILSNTFISISNENTFHMRSEEHTSELQSRFDIV